MLADGVTRWTVTVSKDTDISLRTFLAQRGMKKGDISRYIEEAVKRRMLEETSQSAGPKVLTGFGAFKGKVGSSEEFAREKRAEIEREERRF